MFSITIIDKAITKDDLKKVAFEGFGNMVKAVVDCSKGTMAIGGELHADEEQVLLETGSNQQDLWGINLYPDNPVDRWIVFDSMINLRPQQNNRSRRVEDPLLREKILAVVSGLLQ